MCPTERDYKIAKYGSPLIFHTEEIECLVYKCNIWHFGQAHGTFPTVPPYSECVDLGHFPPRSLSLFLKETTNSDQLEPLAQRPT